MKITQYLLASALSLLTLNATAANLYRPGTQGHELAAYAEKVLPSTVSPYFVMIKDTRFFESQLSDTANKVLSPASLKTLSIKSWSAAPRASAFTVYGRIIPETERRNVCVVVFAASDRAKVGSTLMHELMHCRIGAAEVTEAYTKQAYRAAATVAGIPAGPQLSMFEEVFARAMSLTFMVNQGIKEDGDFFVNRLNKPYPMNPGPKSVTRAMSLCIEKDSCSVEVAALAKRLLDDREFVEDLRSDMIQAHRFNVKAGFVPE